MKFKPSIKPYTGPAGGWGSLEATTRFVLDSKQTLKNMRNLMRVNKARGFDCPGCAWGDDNHSTFSFCENGAKAVSWEATRSAVEPEFFAAHSVSTLQQQSDYFLEYQGRLTHPMRYNAETDHYEPIHWPDALALIAKHINGMDNPNQIELYTSGRASNEASYLYQLFGRMLGTSNFPDCSNMCHEASGVGLKQSIGVGKGTIRIDDFENEKRRPTRRAYRQFQHPARTWAGKVRRSAGSGTDADAKILADQLFLLPAKSGRRYGSGARHGESAAGNSPPAYGRW